MFSSIVLYLLAAVGSFILITVVRWLVEQDRRRRQAKAMGCKPLCWDIYSDRLGILNVYRMISSNIKKEFPEHYAERFRKNSEHYGRPVTTVRVRLLGDDAIITCDPTNIQAMLATQFKDFGMGPNRFGNFSPLLGSSIFSVDGPRWEHARALMRPQFARDQISDLEMNERHFQNLLLALKPNSDGWTSMTDLQPLFFRLTIDTSCEFLFGEPINTQLAYLPGAEQKVRLRLGDVDERDFAKAFDDAQSWMAFAGRLGDKHKWGHTKKFRHSVKQVHKFIDHYVHIALNKEAKQVIAESTGKTKYTFLAGLAEVETDPDELRGHLLSILLAGRDTTASFLGWFFVVLAQNPKYWDKLRAVIVGEFGDWNSCDRSKISFESLKNCVFLQQCMKEVLRLYPLISLNARTAVDRDTTLPIGGGPDGKSPIFINKGMECQFTPHALHRIPHLWGPDVESFRPERWENRRTGWDYLPFNGGPRICIGQQFALTQVGFLAVRLLQRFDTMDNSALYGRKMRQGLTLVNTPGDPVLVRFHESDSR